MRPFFKEFKDLRRKPDRRRSLPDLLNFAFTEDEHTIIMKDGARIRMFGCVGPDLNSASAEELDAHRAHANRALRPLPACPPSCAPRLGRAGPSRGRGH